MEDLKKYIRVVPNFPSEGIMFKDITPLLANPAAFIKTIDLLSQAAPDDATHIAAIEARGFLFGPAVAAKLGLPFVPVRKYGKLPYETISIKYELEYGKNELSIHTDAITPGAKVFLVDDLIATGGTLAAACSLVEQCQGSVIKIACLIELAELKGKKLLGDIPITSLLVY